MYMAERICDNVFVSEKKILSKKFYPKIGVCVLDGRSHWETTYETLIIG